MSEMRFVDTYDALTGVEDELAAAREVATKAVDRADALAQLRSHILELQDEFQRPVRLSEVFETKDETQRARLAALADRITREVD